MHRTHTYTHTHTHTYTRMHAHTLTHTHTYTHTHTHTHTYSYTYIHTRKHIIGTHTNTQYCSDKSNYLDIMVLKFTSLYIMTKQDNRCRYLYSASMSRLYTNNN